MSPAPSTPPLNDNCILVKTEAVGITWTVIFAKAEIH
jgi:hypothetical protein